MLRKLPVLAVIAILIGTTLLLPAPAPAQKVLKIGYPVWVGYGPLFLADKKGFLKDEGVSVQFINMEDTKTRYVALAAGKIDGLMTTIETIKGLKGKKVAYGEGSVSHFLLGYLLKQNGMSFKDIVSVNMTAGEAGAAFVARKVDAAVTWEPWLTKGKSAAHGHLLADSTTTPGLIVDVLVFRNDVLRARGDEVRKVVAAWHKGVE